MSRGSSTKEKKALLVVTSVTEMSPVDKEKAAAASIATGWYLPELAMAYILFKQAGYRIEIASITGGQTIIDPGSFHYNGDILCNEAMQDRTFQAMFNQTRKLSEYEGGHFNVLYFAGGLGCMMDFPFSPSVKNLVLDVYESGSVIGAVDHASVIFAHLTYPDGRHLIENKRITGATKEEDTAASLLHYLPKHHNGLSSVEDLLIAAGADYSKESMFTPHVVIDERIVTGQNAISTAPVIDAIIALADDDE